MTDSDEKPGGDGDAVDAGGRSFDDGRDEEPGDDPIDDTDDVSGDGRPDDTDGAPGDGRADDTGEVSGDGRVDGQGDEPEQGSEDEYGDNVFGGPLERGPIEPGRPEAENVLFVLVGILVGVLVMMRLVGAI